MDRIPSFHRHTKSLSSYKTTDATIQSFTVIHNPPHGFGSTPYTIALVEHPCGKRVMAQLTVGAIEPCIGATVRPVLRHIRTMESGLLMHDYKYEVVSSMPSTISLFGHYILAVSGPSGVGKTTIARQLLALAGVTEQVPIYTTRKKRAGDTEPYVHVSKEQFDTLIKRGEIVSHTMMPSQTEDRHYGYRRIDIEAIWSAGKLPVVVTELSLLRGLVDTFGRRSVLSFGLLPPGTSKRSRLSALLHRLRLRGNQTDDQIAERMKVAEEDLGHFDLHPHLFDHLIVNDEIDSCSATISRLAKLG